MILTDDNNQTVKAFCTNRLGNAKVRGAKQKDWKYPDQGVKSCTCGQLLLYYLMKHKI